MGGESGKTGATVIAVGAAALLISMFAFNWYAIDVPEEIPTPPDADLSFNAWDAFDIIDYGLLAVAGIALVAALVAGTQRGEAVFAAGAVAAAAGAAGFLVLAYRAIEPPTLVIDGIAVEETGGVEIGTELGAVIGILAMACIAVGGWLSLRASGTTVREAVRRLDQALGEDQEVGDGPPPPPRAPAA